tara:strand:+ start:484 stop:2793 length:2310 start_codon:yes stop_codon:yes gene_type:complete
MTYSNILKRCSLITAIFFSTVGISTIYAADEESGVLEEVIVTAQKREQALVDTPISMTAISGSTLDDLNITDVLDIGKFSPNVLLIKSPNSATGIYPSIRGGHAANPAITYESSVGVYLNGAFIGKNMGALFDVVDVERIEILRGPQGTLYGKNTTGGAINIISRTPSGEGGGSVKLTAGENGRKIVKLNLSPASSGPVKMSLALRKEEYDGWIDNTADPLGNFFASPAPSNDGFGIKDDLAGMLTISYSNDNFDLSYFYDFNDTDRTNEFYQVTRITPFGIQDSSPAAVAALGPYSLAFLGMAQYSCVTGCKKRRDSGSNNDASRDDAESDGHSLIMTWDMGGYELKSTTTRREFEVHDILDHDSSPLAIARTQRDIDYEALSQEIQLSGSGSDGSSHWVLGYYHFEDDGYTNNPQEFLMVFGPGGLLYDSQYGLETDSDAIYGQVDWSPASSPSWTYTLGARYTKEEKTGERIFRILQDASIPAPMPLAVIPYTQASEDFSDSIFNIIVSKQLNENTNFYAKVSEGWKAGSFNGETSSQAVFVNAFKPQSTTSIEAGLKSRFADGKGAFNLAVFQDTHEDKQEFIFLATNAAESVVKNFGEQEITGVEAELYYQASPNLYFQASIGTLDAEYNEARDDAGNDVSDAFAHPFVPDLTTMLTLDYNFGSGPRGTAGIRIDAYTNDGYTSFPDPEDSARINTPSHELIDIRLYLNDFQLGDNMTADISFWGKNVTDEEFPYTGYDFGGFGWSGELFNDPTEYGVDFTIRW